MATLEEIQAAQVETDAKVAAVAADVTALLAKIAGFPAPGLTPEQQAAIDDIAAHAGKINEALAGVDAAANPAPRSASIAAMSMTASSASSYPQWSSTLTLAD